MPWIAIHDGDHKAPRQVPKGVDVECPSCEDRMRVRGKSSDGRAHHFFHVENIGGAEGGRNIDCESVSESKIHMKWKSLAADRLEQEFGDRIETCEMEYALAAPVSEKEQRYADAAIVFSEPDEQLGRGLAVEVQHKNEGKDIAKTTADYTEQGFAVAWVDERDFSTDRCQLAEVDFRHRARDTVWPDFVPDEARWQSRNTPFDQLQERRMSDWDNELVDDAGRVLLPTEWVDRTALEIWRSQPWDSIFRPSNTGLYELQGLLSQAVFGRELPPPTMPPEFVDTVAQSLWNRQPWEDLFEPPRELGDVFEGGEFTRTAKVDFDPWVQ